MPTRMIEGVEQPADEAQARVGLLRDLAAQHRRRERLPRREERGRARRRARSATATRIAQPASDPLLRCRGSHPPRTWAPRLAGRRGAARRHGDARATRRPGRAAARGAALAHRRGRRERRRGARDAGRDRATTARTCTRPRPAPRSPRCAPRARRRCARRCPRRRRGAPPRAADRGADGRGSRSPPTPTPRPALRALRARRLRSSWSPTGTSRCTSGSPRRASRRSSTVRSPRRSSAPPSRTARSSRARSRWPAGSRREPPGTWATRWRRTSRARVAAGLRPVLLDRATGAVAAPGGVPVMRGLAQLPAHRGGRLVGFRHDVQRPALLRASRAPPPRPELPEGVWRPEPPAPPADETGDGSLPRWPLWAPFAGACSAR